jgi:hypothetical protein
MLHPSFKFFKTEDSESRLILSQSLQLNLRLGGYSIWSAILQLHFHINLDFKTDVLDHLPASWQFEYYHRLLQAVPEDAQELLEEASRLLELLLSTTT